MPTQDHSSTIRRPPSQAEMSAIDAACRSGNLPAAMRMAAEAMGRGAEHPVILMLAAHDCLSRDAVDEALACALRARSLSPRDPEVLNVYGMALAAGGRAREALTVYDNALRQTPGRPGLHYNKGCAYEDMNELGRARACFERAVALQPNNPQYLGRLAYIAALRGDTAEARRHGERAPGDPTAILAVAMSDVETKDFAAALNRLAPLLRGTAGINRSIAEGLAADALDGLGRSDEAFRAYAASNATRRTVFRPRFEGHDESALAIAARLAAWFDTSGPWPHGNAGKAGRTHVFLVGFPRSGTTLLEQVLATHPDIESLEERPCLADSVTEFLGTGEGLERLRDLSDEDCETWRDAYWTHAAEWGAALDKPVFIDKLPLNTVCLPLIARLFPDAKVLFALRDPADVVWSCFRRRFGMSLAMYEFLTLDGAARYYSAVMDLAALYREKLPLDVYDVRYESFVANFESEARAVCAFLGIEWRDELADFSRRVKERGVDTPSAAQVARGLFKSGIGQWRAYEQQLAAVLPILAPWRARFGYA